MRERCRPHCDLDMGLETTVLNQVIEGSKKVEGRLRRGKFLQMELGRIVCLREDIWRNGEEIGTIPDRARIQVVRVQDFTSFKEMFETVGLENVLPGVRTIDEGLDVYYQFYDSKQEDEYGVRGITMEYREDLVASEEPQDRT
jgi:ASC-1-like (ASCH) protein